MSPNVAIPPPPASSSAINESSVSDCPEPEDIKEEWAVHLRFPATERRRLCRREHITCADGHQIWTERPLLLERVDGFYELIGTSANLSGLARWILSFAADAKVESPPVLQEKVQHLARRVVQVYSSDDG